MMHSVPMPLKVALDTAKRLRTQLSKHLTPEQHRDFSALERLLAQAEQQHAPRPPRSNGRGPSLGSPGLRR